jgi:hypothetical protein
MRPGRPGIDPAHLILALFRVHLTKRLPNPVNFSRQLKVIIATRSALMHCAICRRVQHPTFLIQPLITKSQHTRPELRLVLFNGHFCDPFNDPGAGREWAVTKGRCDALNRRI